MSEDKTVRSTSEAVAKSSDLLEIVSYIAEREKNLSAYSGKLRQSVQRIFDVFGDPSVCQVCDATEWVDGHTYEAYKQSGTSQTGSWVRLRPSEVKEGCIEVAEVNDCGHLSDEVLEKMKTTSWATFYSMRNFKHAFKAKIRLSLDLKHLHTHGHIHYFLLGETPHDDYYFLNSHDGGLNIGILYGSDPEDCSDRIRDMQLSKVRRSVLKALVKSGAITKFLQAYLQKLQDAEEEYHQISEVAEKLAAAVQ